MTRRRTLTVAVALLVLVATPVGLFAGPVVAQETTENGTATEAPTDDGTAANESVDNETDANDTVENETEAPENETEDETEASEEETEDETTSETIETCTVIDESGTYTIGENFSADGLQEIPDPGVDANASACIVVAADDVTLEGQDIRVSGPNADETGANETDTNETNASENLTVGVAVAGDNVTVEQPSLDNFDVGVHLADASDSSVNNLEVVNADRAAVVFAGASNNTVRNVTVANVGSDEMDVNETDANETETNETDTFSGAFVFVDSGNNTVENAVVNDTAGWTVYSQTSDDANNTSDASANAAANANADPQNASQNATAMAAENNSVENVTVNETTFSAEFRNVNIGPATDAPDAPEDTVVVGEPLRTQSVADDSALELTFHYEESELEAAGTDELSLSVYRATDESWEPVIGTVISLTNDTGTVTVNQPGTYALVGETTDEETEPTDEVTDETDTNETVTNETETNETVENETDTEIDLNDTVENDTTTDDTVAPEDETNDTTTVNDSAETETDTTVGEDTATEAPGDDTATESVGNETVTESSGNVTAEV